MASGARYAAARALTGLSQRALARRLEVSPQAVSNWESGKSEPTRENARALAGFSGCSLEWLLTGKGRPETGSPKTTVADFRGKGRLVPEVGDTLTGIRREGRGKPGKFVQTYFPCSPKSIALTVAGNSMAPEFMGGDIVVIDPQIRPVPGDYVFVEIDDGETKLFRKYRPHTERKGVVESYDLVPANEDWNAVRVTSDDKAIVRGVMSEHIAPRRRA